jgi:cell cycle sensor histidine kinase DivJ
LSSIIRAALGRPHETGERETESYVMHARVLAEVIGDVVLRYDASGRVISASGSARSQFGLTPEDLLGSGLGDRVHVCDRSIYANAIDECFNSDAPVNVALRLRTTALGDAAHTDADFAWAEIRLLRLSACAAKGDSAAFVGVARNISEAKTIESKLDAARAQAESASSWKDRLLANVSHELRTPLNAIIGFSEMLCRADLAPGGGAKQREYAGIIHASAEHLLSVVNLILDMSKIDAGRFEISPEPFELAPLIAACCDMLRLKAEAGGIALIRGPLNCPSEIIADKRAFRQVLINLLSNAVKFTPRGGQVVIAAEMAGDMIHLSILDTGIGIAEDHLPRLGDPFFQARASYDRLYEGTGLGLSLVRGLVSLLGGSLLVESAAEIGTRVTARLPVDCRAARRPEGALPRIETAARLTLPASLAKPQVIVQEKKIA